MENMWPLYPNKLLNNWEHLVTLSQYLENMWPLYSNIWKTFNPHLIQYLGTCDHFIPIFGNLWPLYPNIWEHVTTDHCFSHGPTEFVVLFLNLPQFCVDFRDLVGIWFWASLATWRFWRVWWLQWNLSLHWKRWSVCLAMLSEGILTEIESICSSVGKKGGKKWVQFVSVAANKIWASVRGKGTKKACRKITWPIFHSWRGLKILFPSFQLCGSITKQSFMVLLVPGLPTEIWPKNRDLCKKRPQRHPPTHIVDNFWASF